MSLPKNLHQAERWLLTAQEDLRAAETLAAAAMHAQSCFLAQQSREKALKALWYAADADPWGHSLQRLLNEFPQREALGPESAVTEAAGLLDQFYIPTRYPNGLPDLTPGQVYTQADSRRGVEAAQTILGVCRHWLDETYRGAGQAQEEQQDE